MNSRAQPANEVCYHCLETLPKFGTITALVDGVAQPMCCLGCKAAATFIQQNSLTRFYEHRDRGDHRDFFGSLNTQELAFARAGDWQFLDHSADPRHADYVHVDSLGNRNITLLVHGLYCSSCGWLIERAIHSISNDIRVHIELDALRVTINVLDSKVALANVLATIAQLGYRPELLPTSAWFELEQSHKQERLAALRRLMVAGFCMMQVMTFAVGTYFSEASGQSMSSEYQRFFLLVSMLVATAAVFYSGRPFFSNAFNDLRNGHFGMDVPIALAVGGAYFPSVYEVLSHSVGDITGAVYFDSAVMFVFFLSIGRYVEMRARHRLADSSGEINRLLPDTIMVLREANGALLEQRIKPKEVALGDQLTVRAGDVVPFDAQVVSGVAYFDESLITGESTAVEHRAKESLCMGTRLVSGEVRLTASKVWSESSLFKINQMVQNVGTLVQPDDLSQMGRNFVVWVLLLTVLVASIWWFIAPERVFHIVLAMLVASCPCAFSLAAPVARTAAAHSLRRLGVLLANPSALIIAPTITHWLFDKTGTLTLGKPNVERVVTFGTLSESQCLTLVADVERFSDHPIAHAFSRFASAAHERVEIDQWFEEPGCGITARYAGLPIVVGKHQWVMQQLNSEGSAKAAADAFLWADQRHAAASEIVVALDGHLIAAIYISDGLRSSSVAALRHLLDSGVALTVVSGDKESVVASACEELGVLDYQANSLPADKLALLRTLHSKQTVVAMVGDGVNDAPVLAAADLSIALATGSELSQYHADVVLLNGDLGQLAQLLDVARKTDVITKQNLRWSLLYNGLALPLAAAGYLTPWLAALGMSMSSLLVVLNALRIRARANTP